MEPLCKHYRKLCPLFPPAPCSHASVLSYLRAPTPPCSHSSVPLWCEHLWIVSSQHWFPWHGEVLHQTPSQPMRRTLSFPEQCMAGCCGSHDTEDRSRERDTQGPFVSAPGSSLTSGFTGDVSSRESLQPVPAGYSGVCNQEVSVAQTSH